MHSITGFNPELCGTHNVDCMYFMIKHYNLYRPNTSVRSVMARRKVSRTKKLPPTELTLYSYMTEAGSYIADLGAMLSQVNRKSFRQGYQYAVASIEFYAPEAGVLVGRLPHHWPCVNGWTKAMNMWRQQQNDRLEESGLTQTIARHRDFKIFFNGDHAAGNYTELQPTTFGTGTPASTNYRTLSSAQAISATVDMDWDKSEIVWPNYGAPGTTVERNLHMLGDDEGTTSVGIIKAYAESRNRPMQTDPNIVDVALGGAFGSMFDVADDSGDIITNAQEHNTALPYLNDIDSDDEFYPGGTNTGNGATIVDTLAIAAGNRTIASSTVGPFLANCGLLLFATDAAVTCKITLAPGDYKGVMARPMQDVN